MQNEKAIRAQVRDFLAWGNAHADFARVVTGIPPRARGIVPKGFVHSAWQILEHIRIAQPGILDFCRNPKYREKKWPDDYWPKTPAPRSAGAWRQAVADFRRDLRAVQRMAVDPRVDLTAKIPHGTGQTYLREILLVADHNAHHLAQIIDIRRALGHW